MSVKNCFCEKLFLWAISSILSHFEKYHCFTLNKLKWGEGHKFIMLSFRGHSKLPVYHLAEYGWIFATKTMSKITWYKTFAKKCTASFKTRKNSS
jgi:hypothetical protein